METAKLKKFAQHARTTLIDTVATKLDFVLEEGSSARRENLKAVKKLENEITYTSQEQVIEKIAYIWFNRFIALRFMDVNRYTKMNIVSPEEGQSQPVILSDAKMGHVDDSLVSETEKEKVLALLENRTPSQDPQGEAYKLLVVSACNYYSHAMPFLFEKIADYTELLMPDDLLSGTSILKAVREAMTPDVCKDVEVIGWLYQFYISERKEEVDLKVKNGGKVTTAELPAKTQVFTPNWVVRYMVENSLGRLWMLNNPDSRLKMEYYIKPETPEDDYLKIEKPQELKICDPACGSGHILVYAFDLLFEIYKEAGFTDDDAIIENILKHNLYGIEIDERAAELAAFSLAMKAALRSGSKRRFFRNPIEVNICKLENISFSNEEINSYMDAINRDLFTSDLQTTLRQFEEADNFGSLIQPEVKDVTATLQTLKENKQVTQDMFLAPTHEKVLQVLEQADYLSQKYHVVIANPPYLGNKGMNDELKDFVQSKYPKSKYDLFASFIENSFNLSIMNGYTALVTMQSWMFTTRYEQFRDMILQNTSIESMVHMGNGVMGIAFGTCATVFKLSKDSAKKAFYYYVEMDDIKDNKPYKRKRESYCSIDDYKLIPETPIVYWANNTVRNLFGKSHIKDFYETREGLATANNDLYIRQWQEVSLRKVEFFATDIENIDNLNKRWFAYIKGGAYRKWAGNTELVVDWEEDGKRVKNNIDTKTGRIRSHNYNGKYAFKEGFTWSGLSSGGFSVRYVPGGYMFDAKGPMGFKKDNLNLKYIIGFLNSKVATYLLKMLSPTMDFKLGHVLNLPIINIQEQVNTIVNSCNLIIDIEQLDWDTYEDSWEYKKDPLLNYSTEKLTIETAYNNLCLHWSSLIDELKQLEEKNNIVFIEAYGLKEELKNDAKSNLSEITLTCNPYYRYDAKKSKEELDELQLADTMKEYISYAVGVMLGRYSLDHDGLHIADVDVSIDEANEKFNIQTPTFEADDDNVIPILDGDWFTDDISERFLQFVKVTFSEEHYEENVQFIEDAIGKSIRKYFVKDFYPDHVKRYKKRPIYWMFSSPKGSFQALIYMHRYKSDTVSVILNDYLRDYITKLEATKENLEAVGINASASKTEKTKAIKEIEKIKKMIIELVDYEKDIMYPLATQKIEIDLDDGVKHNYPLFGQALKKVTGLS